MANGHILLAEQPVVVNGLQLAALVVVVQDAVHAHHVEATAVEPKEAHHGAALRQVVVHVGGVQVVNAVARQRRLHAAAPQVLAVVDEDAAHEVVNILAGEALGLHHLVSAGADGVQAVARRAYEDVARGVLDHAHHARLRTLGEGVALEGVGGIVVAHQTLAATHPQTAAAVDEERRHLVAHQRRSVALVGEILHKLIAVEAVQTVVGAHPDEAVGILRDTVDGAVRHLVSAVQRTAGAISRNRGKQQQAADNNNDVAKTYSSHVSSRLLVLALQN